MNALVIYDIGIGLTLVLGLVFLLRTHETRAAMGRLRWIVAFAGVNATLLAYSERGGSAALGVACVNAFAVGGIWVAYRFGLPDVDDPK